MTTAKEHITEHQGPDGLRGTFHTPAEGPVLFAAENGPVLVVLSRDEYEALKRENGE